MTTPTTSTSPPPTTTNSAALELRAAAGPGYAGEWDLFCDYTTATGAPTLPTTVEALAGFLTALPAHPHTLTRRVRAIAVAHRRAGYLLARPDTGPAAPPTTPARRRPDPGLMIAACPTRGWPHSLAGRRDGFLIVLTEVLELSHGVARNIHAADITVTTESDTGTGAGLAVDALVVPASDDPRTCPACAVVRWLDILGTADGLGRSSARAALYAAHAPIPTDPHQHVPAVPARWRAAPVLLPAIDRHGWHDDYRPMTTRTIRTRLTHAATRTGLGLAAEHDDVGAPPWTVDPSGADAPRRAAPELHEVLGLLDDVAEDADALNTRIRALLEFAGP